MYTVQPLHIFEQLKNRLKKKYPRIEQDYAPLVQRLKQGDFEGDELQDFSALVYKVRVGSIDQKKGKRGGFRIIYHVLERKKLVYLIAIYPKARQKDLTPEQKQKFKKIVEQLEKL